MQNDSTNTGDERISGNIFNLPDNRQATSQNTEVFNHLFTIPGICIEQIVSFGQASPPGFYYRQDWDEWVMLCRGEAEILFPDSNKNLKLKAGDWLFIAKNQRHRIEKTSQNAVWLAVHMGKS